MKRNIKFSMIVLAMAAMGFTGCQNSYDAPDLTTPEATMQPNTTLLEFKEFLNSTLTAEGVDAVVIPKKADGSDYIIHGRVISSDASGNIYQNLVIQDETAALTLAIREASMWTTYRVGQDVVLNATDLYMGSYSGLLQIGGLDEYQGDPSITFMSWFQFKEHSQLNGMPNQDFADVSVSGPWPSDRPYRIITTIAELSKVSTIPMMSQLVEIQNVSFQNAGEETFANYQENNCRRYVYDPSNPNETLLLNNSGYSNFYNQLLPEGVGMVRGILSYYSDSWQLVVRGLDDILFDMTGSETDPYTVAEALAQNNSGRTGWTQGYVVGSIKPGVTTVTSDDDIIFGARGELDDNVLIADNPAEKDWTKCIAVQLPINSIIWRYINLVDNPERIGKLLNVEGRFQESDYGMPGITGNNGTNFHMEAVVLPGTQDNPFAVNEIISNPVDQTDVWVAGYIVGYVEGTSYATGAKFGLPAAGANYNGANVIIADSPEETDPTKCIPVMCDRNAVGLINHPENLGKKFGFLGNVGILWGNIGMPIVTNQQEMK